MDTLVNSKLKSIHQAIKAMQEMSAEDEEFLLKMRDVPEETYEVLLLMHMYYKKNLSNVTNTLSAVTKDVSDITRHNASLLDEANEPTEGIKVKYLKYIGIIFGSVTTFMWLAYTINPEATEFVIDNMSKVLENIKLFNLI